MKPSLQQRVGRVDLLLIGLYLILPIMSAQLKKATKCFVQEAYDSVGGIMTLPPLVRILLMAVMTFGASYLSVRILLWMPAVTRRFVQ